MNLPPVLKKILKTGIPVVFYGLLVIFLILYLRSIDWQKLQNIEISWPFLVIATIFGLGARYFGAFIWFVLLKSLGAENLTHKLQLTYVYAKSWMGRYIPGTAPWILGKIYFASQHGVSKNKLAVSSLLEGALQIAVLMGLSFIMLIFDPRLNVIDERLKLAMVALLIICVIAMTPPVFNFIIATVYRLLKRKAFAREHMANSQTILKGASLYSFGAILNGLSLFFIAKTVYPELNTNELFFIMGVGNLAGAAGMLAVFAPSGIGVREGIQLVLLSLVMPAELALLVTVITRVWGIGVDFLFFGLTKLIVFATGAPIPKQPPNHQA